MSKKENTNSPEDDVKEILSAISEIKEKLSTLTDLPKDSQEELSKASELIENVIKKSSESYDLENKPNKESAKQAEEKGGDKKDGADLDTDKKESPFKKDMPSPQSGDSIDDFITRCMYSANARELYADQQDRFKACMLQGNGFDFRQGKATPPFVEQKPKKKQ